jgi:dipeptidyl aminopeptidase/acylaminoacyl peptidase
MNADGTRLASGGADDTVRIWDQRSGQLLGQVLDHGTRIWSVAFSPDSTWLASGGNRGSLFLTPLSGGGPRKLTGHEDEVHSLAFSPDGTRLASGGTDGSIRVWNVASGEEELVIPNADPAVYSVAFSADGRRLVSSGTGLEVVEWDSRSGIRLRGAQGHRSGEIVDMVFDDQDRTLITFNNNGTAAVWDTQMWEVTHEIFVGVGVRSGAYNPADRRMAVGTTKGVEVYDLDLVTESSCDVRARFEDRDLSVAAYLPAGYELLPC